MQSRPALRVLCTAATVSGLLLSSPRLATGHQTTPQTMPAAPSTLQQQQEQEIDRQFEASKAVFMTRDMAAAERAFQAGLAKAQTLGYERRIASFLNGLGGVYLMLGQLDKSWDHSSRALAINERIGREESAAGCLALLGMICQKRGQLEQASEYYNRALVLREKVGNEADIAATLTDLGSVYSGSGHLDKALDCYERAATFYQKLGDERSLAFSQHALGDVCFRSGLQSRALDYYRLALNSFQHLGDDTNVSVCLNNLGHVCNATGQQSMALEYFSRALPISEKQGDVARTADNMVGIGSVHARLGNFDKAIENYKHALEIYEKVGDAKAAASLSHLGLVYTQLGQFNRALACYRRALTIREESGDALTTGHSLGDLSSLYQEMGHLNQALEHRRRALAAYEKTGDGLQIAQCLSHLGQTYLIFGRLDQALEYHNRALAVHETLGSTQGTAYAYCLINLGFIYKDIGQFDQALAYGSRALLILEKAGDTSLMASSLSNLASVYKLSNQYDKTLDYENRALLLYEQMGDLYGITQQLNNIASTYTTLNQYDKALSYHSRALKLSKKIGSIYLTAISLTFLADLSEKIERPIVALDYRKRALTQCERLGSVYLIASYLSALGNTYERLSEIDQALDSYKRALIISRGAGNTRNEAFSLLFLGALDFRSGRLDQALERYKRAVSLRRSNGDVADWLIMIGNVYEKKNDFGKAEAAYVTALRKYERMYEHIGEASQVGDFQQAIGGRLYAHYAHHLLRRSKAMQALVAVERGRGRGLVRQMVLNKADLARLTSQSDAARWTQAVSAFTIADRFLGVVQQQLAQATPADKSAVKKQLDDAKTRSNDAERALDVLRADLYQRYPAYRRLRGAIPPTAAALNILAAKNPDTLYLEWAVVDDKTMLVFALSRKDGLKTFTLPTGDKTLAARVKAWRETLVDPSAKGLSPQERTKAYQRAPKEPEEAKALSRLLLGRLEKAGLLKPSRYARLVVVADGPLLDIPFAALMDASGKRLIERYAVSTSVSLGMLTWPANQRQPTATLLAAADPNAPGERVGSQPVQAAALRGDDDPLPGAREEAKQVAGLFGDSLALIGAQAREAEVKQRMGQYALLHFVTHGRLMNPGMRSWLKMTPEPLDSPENGLLEAREIAGMSLSARLAVLSACESGRGQKSGGEGLLGLAWAFRAAGCPSIVASQWPVSDKATKDLMVAFYQELKKSGKRKDEALRAAMLRVRKNPQYASPYYWAGFQLIGDTAPLALAPLPTPTTATPRR